jgi:hypothetical protein
VGAIDTLCAIVILGLSIPWWLEARAALRRSATVRRECSMLDHELDLL